VVAYRTALSNASLFGVALLTVGIHYWVYPVFDPSEVWGDHYFYWSQAHSWLNVGEPLYLSDSASSQLRDLYEDASYVDERNDPAFQDPYAYRPLVPIAAGAIGHVVGLHAGFLVVSAISVFSLAFLCGLGTFKLTNSLPIAWCVTAISIWLPVPIMAKMISWYVSVDVPAMALTALVGSLVAFKKFGWAAATAGLVIPLVRETLLPLATFVAIYALLQGRSRMHYWILAAMPFLLYGVIRLVTPVRHASSTSDLLLVENPLRSVYLFIDTYGLVFLIIAGLATMMNREFAIALVPLLTFLFILTASVLSVPRHWTSIWPLLLMFGAVGIWMSSSHILRLLWMLLVLATFAAWEAIRLGLLPRDSLFVLTIFGIAWLFIRLYPRQKTAKSPSESTQRRSALRMFG